MNERKLNERKLIASFDPELKARKGRLILRRYLDLPKLVDLLRTSELYLGQASRFDDRLEGTLPEQVRQGLRDLPDFVAKYGDPTFWEQEHRNRTYLSCWTLGAKDNMALWKLYGSATASVAITTTIKRLTNVAPSWGKYGNVEVKKVRYIDHAGRLRDGVYGLDASVFGLKHAAYSFEKEVRIVVTRPNPRKRWPAPRAIRVPVNLDQFLRSIVVAPEAGDWFFDLVADVARRYSVAAPVRKSALSVLLSRTKTVHK